MRVLVACEESQAVCIAFRELGHEAWSNTNHFRNAWLFEEATKFWEEE